jgi:hypothetical protein
VICFNLLIFFLNLQLNQCGCFLSTSFHTDSNRLAGIFRGGASKPSQYLTGGTMADACIAGLAFLEDFTIAANEERRCIVTTINNLVLHIL